MEAGVATATAEKSTNTLDNTAAMAQTGTTITTRASATRPVPTLFEHNFNLFC